MIPFNAERILALSIVFAVSSTSGCTKYPIAINSQTEIRKANSQEKPLVKKSTGLVLLGPSVEVILFLEDGSAVLKVTQNDRFNEKYVGIKEGYYVLAADSTTPEKSNELGRVLSNNSADLEKR